MQLFVQRAAVFFAGGNLERGNRGRRGLVWFKVLLRLLYYKGFKQKRVIFNKHSIAFLLNPFGSVA